MTPTRLLSFGPRQLRRALWALAALWTLAVAASVVWNSRLLREAMFEAAAHDARKSFDKDLLYRRWASSHGGVYVPTTAATPPNPYLAGAFERDLVTPSGRRLTLLNPAYMTRQVHELGLQYGSRGHITSLKPLRPENTPDPWEAAALRAFEQGRGEVSSRETLDGAPYLRFMRPLIAEAACLKCHAAQGYKEGEIRGGLSVSVPLAPYLAVARARTWPIAGVHAGLWALGLLGILLGGRLVRQRLDRQVQAEADRERLIQELQHALASVKSLSGLLPICAGCKKIRDDKGYWSQVESYLQEHSEATFTHGMCPDCIKKFFPELGETGPG